MITTKRLHWLNSHIAVMSLQDSSFHHEGVQRHQLWDQEVKEFLRLFGFDINQNERLLKKNIVLSNLRYFLPLQFFMLKNVFCEQRDLYMNNPGCDSRFQFFTCLFVIRFLRGEISRHDMTRVKQEQKCKEKYNGSGEGLRGLSSYITL